MGDSNSGSVYLGVVAVKQRSEGTQIVRLQPFDEGCVGWFGNCRFHKYSTARQATKINDVYLFLQFAPCHTAGNCCKILAYFRAVLPTLTLLACCVTHNRRHLANYGVSYTIMPDVRTTGTGYDSCTYHRRGRVYRQPSGRPADRP